MATLQHLIMLKCMICYSSLFSLFLSFPIEASEIQYRTMHVVNKDIVQTSGCTPTIGGSTTKLVVTHRYGSRRPSIAEILSHDQLRVDQILARLKPSISSLDSSINDDDTLPAASSAGQHSYVVTIGLGTPTQEQRLVLDTGSELTWTQRFHPERSDSYSQIPCDSTECAESGFISKDDCEKNASAECYLYAGDDDKSGTSDFLVKETLTITTTDDHNDVFPGFVFVHETPNQDTEGTLGLKRGSLSIASQTEKTYGNLGFRYCLPSNESSTTGYLAFGPSTTPDTSFTPLIQLQDNINNDLYVIEITSISVGGIKLEIGSVVFQSRNTVIDSVTAFTCLPEKVYKTMQNAFNIQIKMKNKAISMLNTSCYNTSNVENLSVPTIAFTFKDDVTVELDHSRILYAGDDGESSVLCLAFSAINDIHGDFVIFGTTQQRTLEVVYDVANERLGFRPNACN